MGKLLFIVIIVVLVYWIIRTRKSNKKQIIELLPDASEDMVCCEHCGVHLPENESIASQGIFFCSEEHRQNYLNSEP